MLELLAKHDITIPVGNLAVPDRIFEQASQGRLREMAGLTPGNIAAAAHDVIKRRRPVDIEAASETAPVEA